ncbi:MAG TPA: glycosyltransferase family 39 protein [Thermoanaerobaculia bacterium]|nr:glycosyltransferase family 39 protein [Thermoanaerobaculia bacterium]
MSFAVRCRALCIRHRYGLGVAVLIFATAPLGIASRPLWVGDETREAAIAQEMARTGHYLETRLAGRKIAEKPPFFYASVASSILLGHGVTPLSARFPSILLSALTLLAAAGVAGLLFSARASLFSVLILSTTYLFAVNAHDCVIDVSLTAFVTLALLGFVAASRRERAPRWDIGFGLAAAGALLSKGLVGLVLSGLLTLPFWIFSTPRRRLRDCVSWGAWAAPLSALAVWVGVEYAAAGPSGLWEAFWNQQIGRFLGFPAQEYSHHSASFFFYLLALPGMLFPWIVALPAAARDGIRSRGRRHGLSCSLPLVAAVAVTLLFLSLAGTKRTVYFLPVVPVVAVLLGSFLDTKIAQETLRAGRVLWTQFGIVAASAIAVPLVPALADGLVTSEEAAVVGAVVIPCAVLALLARRSPRRLIAGTLALAAASLVLLDQFSVTRLDRDSGTRAFFASVTSRVAPADRIYAWDLNEGVLGRACLDLPRPPIPEPDARRLAHHLEPPGTYVLAETSVLRRSPVLRSALEVVERGFAGGRAVGLYRLRPAASPSAVLVFQTPTRRSGEALRPPRISRRARRFTAAPARLAFSLRQPIELPPPARVVSIHADEAAAISDASLEDLDDDDEDGGIRSR